MAVASSPLQELKDAAAAAQSFRMYATFDLPGGDTLWAFIDAYRAANGQWVADCSINEARVKSGKVSVRNPKSPFNALDAAMQHVAAAYPKAVLRPDTLSLSISKGTTTAAKLSPVAIQAWHEALGQPVPTLDELAGRRKEARAARKAEGEATIALLKTGKPGVDEFNARTPRERQAADLRKADFSGCDLCGLALYGTRLQEARLAGALLVRASLMYCKGTDADLSGADLTGATLLGSAFLRANLAGANLHDADLSGCDLRGADLTGTKPDGCNLADARYDEHTKWPAGFTPPPEARWRGTGPDPRVAVTQVLPSLFTLDQFEGFLDRLKRVADRAKLDKAMAMLKAERFQLFAKVEGDHLVGVVKSQSARDLVYSCRLGDDGSYGCATQNLNICGGLRGSPCKHLLVLVIGLARAGALDPKAAIEWVRACRGKKPALDKGAITETFLQYKGAEAGAVDWRPTETIPEDFYAL